MSLGFFGYSFSLAVRDTPRPIPTVECSGSFVLFGSWEGSYLVLLGFEALPAFPSLLTLESVILFIAFHSPSSRLRESVGLLSTPFSIAVRDTPRVIPNVECSVPFCSFWLLGGFVIVSRSGLRRCLPSHHF